MNFSWFFSRGKKYCIFFLFVLLQIKVHSSTAGVVGGEEGAVGASPYAALISSSGVAIPLSGDAIPNGTGEINSVAINSSGSAIIGGRNVSNEGYAALVSSSGVTTALTGDATPPSTARIEAVAINSSGSAIIGGSNSGSSLYGALVSSSGVTTALTGDLPEDSGTRINAVSINDAGSGIIAGTGDLVGFSVSAYAAIVSPSGVVTTVSGSGAPVTSDSGSLLSCAINSSGAAIIGGRDANGGYVGVVSSSGVTTALTGDDAPSFSTGTIYSVAINESGYGIAGGVDSDIDTYYAALVSPTGVATAITGDVPEAGDSSEVLAVAINSSRNGILAGQSDGEIYAALVSPAGVATALSEGFPSGENGRCVSAKITDSGIGIIGGFISGGELDGGYVSLVSPTGVVTTILETPSDLYDVFSVDIVDLAFESATDPKSYGVGNSYVNALFALSTQILPNHLNSEMITPSKIAFQATDQFALSLVVDASDSTEVVARYPKRAESFSSYRWAKNSEAFSLRSKYNIWVSPFGEYVYQDNDQNIPELNAWIAGIVTGFEYLEIEDVIFGAAMAYAFNYVKKGSSLGYSKTHQEFASIYASWVIYDIYSSVAFWTGIYQMHDVRRTSFSNIRSNSNVDGWLALPHFEISRPIELKNDQYIEPFFMADWANNWQDAFEETGASGLNLSMKNQYTSLLRTEVGLRFAQEITFDSGVLILKEKGGWVYRLPFSSENVETSFIGSPSSFSIELFSTEKQSLGAVQFYGFFNPCSKSYPYGSLSYQGEFSSSYQSHLINLEVGKVF